MAGLRLILAVVMGAVAFGIGASVLVQWASGRSAVFSVGLALAIVLALTVGAFVLLSIAAAGS